MPVNGYKREEEYEDKNSPRYPTMSWIKTHSNGDWTRVFINDDPVEGGYMVSVEDGVANGPVQDESGLGTGLSMSDAKDLAKQWMRNNPKGLAQ